MATVSPQALQRSGGSRIPSRNSIVFVLTAAVAVALVTHADGLGELATSFRDDFGPWALVLFALMGGLLLAATGPASLVNLGAGALFGLGPGTVVASGAALLGSTLAYGVARLLGGRWTAAFAERNPWFAVLRRRIASDWRLALGLRVSPVTPLALTSYGFGLARMRPRLFFATAPAMLPPLFLYVAAGAMARTVWLGEARPWWEWTLLGAFALCTVAVMLRVSAMVARAIRAGRSPVEERVSVQPPVAEREGEPRRVGVEIELGGVTVEDCAEAVASHFGGTVDLQHEGEALVEGPLGTFRVELDSRPVKALAAERAKHEGQTQPEVGAQLDDLKNRMLIGLAEPFVPVEIVTPPLAFDRLPLLDELVTDLREQGARGTHDRVFYAFGVHFNPEVSSTEPVSILAHMRAFFLLRDWIRREGDTDLARRVTPHIEPHPQALLECFMAPEYAPSQGELIDDYLRLSPTRNRDLDMLPLFAHLDEERVRAVLPDEKINPRPTFHYRLPNSQIGDPQWRVSDEWRSWLLVEELAHDRERLDHWLTDWRDHHDEPLGELMQPWADVIDERLRA